MIRIFLILLLIAWELNNEICSQEGKFSVSRAPFSSSITDEFSPVFYKNGIVYCSNMRGNSPVGYNDGTDRLFKIVFVPQNIKSGWKAPAIFSGELTSGFNDGPATFNQTGTKIYFSRNNSIGKGLKNINDSSNKLGIYSAVLRDEKWTDIEPFTHNDPEYYFTTPSISPDGKRIYFSSDMPGGYGGFDLYYCDSVDTGWDKPVNLGNSINTYGNESFPFAAGYGMLFFASDGHKGFGGKDIFYTREVNSKWIDPVHLDSAINSPADDFGLVTDSTLQKGFFSTNRLKTDDIFNFNSVPVEFSKCDTIREDRYCFTFYDEQHSKIDSIQADYVWDFGNGIVKHGTEVRHCFPGPGDYTLSLTIYDAITGDTISKPVSYDVSLDKINQPVIQSFSVGLPDRPIIFNADVSALKDIEITDYYWNFGSGFKPGTPVINHSYRRKGDYSVLLGLIGENQLTGEKYKGCIFRKVRIGESEQLIESADAKNSEIKPQQTIRESEGAVSLEVSYRFMDDLSERQKTTLRNLLKGISNENILIDKNGIMPGSSPMLVRIGEFFKNNPEIIADIIVNAVKPSKEGTSMEETERWASEIAFMLKNNGAPDDINCRGYGIQPSPFTSDFSDDKTTVGHAEIIFMRK